MLLSLVEVWMQPELATLRKSEAAQWHLPSGLPRLTLYRAALVQIGTAEWARTSVVSRPLDHVWVKLGHQLFLIFDLTNVAIELGAFRNR